MINLDTKWNEYPSDKLYLWNGETIFRIAEGDGTNLWDEDVENGYVDYWMTDYYDFEDGNGGQWMETKLISDIDYTIQGVIERIKKCDLWDSDWEIIDESIGDTLFNAFENYYTNRSQARYYNEQADEQKEDIEYIKAEIKNNISKES